MYTLGLVGQATCICINMRGKGLDTCEGLGEGWILM